MKILKCDICGKEADKDNRLDFSEICLDNQKYDLCNTCTKKYKQLKHDLMAAFIFYPDRKIEIQISKKDV